MVLTKICRNQQTPGWSVRNLWPEPTHSSSCYSRIESNLFNHCLQTAKLLNRFQSLIHNATAFSMGFHFRFHNLIIFRFIERGHMDNPHPPLNLKIIFLRFPQKKFRLLCTAFRSPDKQSANEHSSKYFCKY